MQRFNGLSFVFDFGGLSITAQKFKLEISDGMKVAMRNGRPDGYLLGECTANGSLTLEIADVNKMIEACKDSIQEIDTIDIHAFAEAGGVEFKVEAFGCKLKMSTILDVDKNSSDETTIEVSFDVTSPDFVKINGKNYLKTLEK